LHSPLGGTAQRVPPAARRSGAMRVIVDHTLSGSDLSAVIPGRRSFSGEPGIPEQRASSWMDDDSVAITRTHWDAINKLLEQAPDWIDRGQAATVPKAIAVFEDVLQTCLEGRMRPLTPRMRARLFNGYGPISSFAAKTDIAYALDLLTDHDHADLQIMRKKRNEFAHSREDMGFEKRKIEKMVSRLQRPGTEAVPLVFCMTQ
jgi:hypothetical protein